MKKSLSLTILSVCLLFMLANTVNSQAFTEQTSISLPGLDFGSVAWGDYDSDGDLDILLTGGSDMGRTANIYRNDAGVFTDIAAGLEGVSSLCSASWGDYDNDGDLDILLTGSSSSGYISIIYRNDGGTFSDIGAGLTGVSNGSVAWGDYDNDGDLDIALAGRTSQNEDISRIYRNDNGIFSDILAGLPGVYYSSVAWGDYDNDGDQDLLITGRTGTERISRIYRNENGVFSDIKASLAGVYVGSAAWGDYDNDGDLDIILTGYSSSGDIAKIYRNNNGVFSDIGAGLPGFDSGNAAWGDYDNDGDLDILLAGYGSVDYLSKVFRNDSGSFVDINAGLTPVADAASIWGDYDNDGDLDILLTGYTSSDIITKIYKNNTATPNTVPSTPSGLGAVISGTGVTLSWNKPTDTQTPQSGLTYNLYIGTAPGTVNKKSPMSILASGYRKIVQSGTALTNNWTIKKLTAGTYYWSVQAIDKNFAGSAFPDQGSFTVPFSSSIAPSADQTLRINQSGAVLTVTESSAPASRQWKYSTTFGGPYDQLITGATGTTYIPGFPSTGVYYVICESTKSGIAYISNQVKIIVSDFIEQSAISLTGVESGNSVWGDYDNDGDMDILLAGYNDSDGNIAKIYQNDAGVFNNTGFNHYCDGTVAWGDYDNDGDLDILLSEHDSTHVYRNNLGTFTSINAGLIGVSGGSISWEDYDNDGDLDILITGTSSGSFPVTKIYRNQGGIFTETTSGLTDVTNSSVSWGDYDSDGDMDILITGNSGSKIYRNDNGFFSDIAAGLPSVTYGSGSWGDYDNDGDLDILLTGGNISKIFKNINGTFSDISAALPGLTYSSSAWGDYDNDGDLDILLTGTASTGRISGIYRNTNGIFTEITTSLTGVNYSSASWCDYDNDGDLDVLITGNSTTGRISRIYKNYTINANVVPSAPSNLQTVIGANVVTLSWDKSTDGSTPQPGLTYNLYIGTLPDSANIKTPMAFLSDGYRKLVQRGIQTDSWAIKHLPAGKYYWSVQAIDNSFAGSPFAAQNDFTITFATSINPVTDQTLIINQNGTLLTVSELIPADTRQWKYSTVSGGPYNYDIAGAAGTTYTPNFPDWGTYYVVCVSTKDAVIYTSNEVKISVPVFSEATTDFNVVSRGSTAWSDYDNDGDQDLLLTGNGLTFLYLNDAGYLNYYNAFGSSSAASSAFGDYDNDGDIDLIIAGSSSRIYNNDGAGNFTDISAGLSGASYGSTAWGDYDNDGDLDVLLAGSYFSRVYRNDSGTFTDINAGLTGIYNGSCAWGDYDSDGDLDILITGNSRAGYVSIIYRNDGGFFTDIVAGLPGVFNSSAAWGDYDNDGDLDILLTGYGIINNTGTYIARIYRNDNGVFPDINAGLTGVRYSSASWGDYDNDGDLDIFISGLTASGLISILYRNDSGTFTDINAGFPGVQYASSAWGDYDNDGDLDLVITGQRTSGYFTALYRNNITSPNSVPTAPTGLAATPGSNKVTLSWNKSTDTKTPQNGLSYNIYIGTASGAINKCSPMASLPDGYRRVVRTGIIQKNSIIVKNLPMGFYFWSVQAVDNAFAGSLFGTEGSFTIPFSSSISPAATQTIGVSQDGTMLTVTESAAPTSRQWKYSTAQGGPYNQTIAGATTATYTPNFSSFGTFYVVCESVFSAVTYTSNEVKVVVPLFSEQTGIVLENMRYSSVSWGDYDNDSDLDILIVGYGSSGGVAKIYNNNVGTFTDIGASLLGLIYSSASWGDYDNDGDLDILISGYYNSDITKIYRNDAGIFNDINASLPGAQFGSASWGDYDNDGDLDILISGSGLAGIYRNDNGVFTDIKSGMKGVFSGSSAWSDYDKDGDLDVLITGISGSDPTARLYRNDNGVFNDIDAGLAGVSYSSVDWGDYDNDGDPDLLITGMGIYSPVSKIYRNDNGILTDINATLTGVYRGSAAWGDYDNDGDLDIMLCGNNSSDGITRIYRNDNGIFTNINEVLTGVQYSGAAWGDYDKDGDLDILLTGNSNSSTYYSIIYKNNILVSNIAPSAPSGLLSVMGANKVTLSWNKSTDASTPQDGLSYNLYIGTSPGSADKKSPMSILPGGYRKIAQEGIQTISCPVKSLPAGDYYWSVQSIDNTYAGSAFAAEQSFTVAYSNSIAPVADQNLAISQNGNLLTVTESSPADSRQWKYSAVSGGPYDQSITGATGPSFTPNFASWGTYYVICESVKSSVSYTSNEVKISLPVFLEQTDINLVGISRGALAWGDYDNDNDQDLIISGYDLSGYISVIYNNNNGNFTDISAGLPGLQLGSSAWGDFDNDGDLDLLITGYYESNNYFSRIYRNDAGIFTDIVAGLTGVYYSAAVWGDYDNDGDLDIFIAGSASSSSFVTKIYRNDSGSFTDIGAEIPGVNRCFAAWGDYDNDGDLDILLTGYLYSGEIISRIYRNDGGSFIDINAGLTEVGYGSSAWGDYDNDGDLDILLSGFTVASEKITKIYNNNNNVFSDINAGLPGIRSGSVAWGDFDNDGDLDILLTGDGPSGYISEVYYNTAGIFTNMKADLTGTTNSSAAWGDYDNDGDLDIILAGNNGSNYISKIYKNTSSIPNTLPLSPTNLQTTVVTLSKTNLSWTKATDTETPQNTLTYNIRVGTTSGDGNIVSPMANATSGYRRINAGGNAGFKNTGFILDNLSPGTYYWSVQAIDQAYAGGAWATESSFTLLAAPVATAATNILQPGFTANWNASALATGYKIDVSTNSAFSSFLTDYNDKDVGNTLNAPVTGLDANTTYYYRVRAYHAGGTSMIYSNTITVTTPQEVAVPVAASATSVTQTGFTANWSAVAVATSYVLDVATDNAFTSFVSGFENRNVGLVTTYDIGSLAPNTSYYYRVRANGPVGTSVSSNTIAVTTLPDPPVAPASISAESLTSSEFTLRWRSSASATTYYLDISAENTFASFVSGYNNFNNGGDTSKTVTGLSPLTEYYFRVRAANTGGISVNSPADSVTTHPPVPAAPLEFGPTNIYQNGFTALWGASENAAGYYLDVASDISFTSMVPGYDNKDVGYVLSHDVTGLIPNTEYYHRVRAYNVSGTSGSSTAILVTTLPEPPAAPSGLTASSCNDLVTLSWTANTEEGFVKYYIYGGTTSNPDSRIDSTMSISEVTKTLPGLTSGETYYFRVTAEIYPKVESVFSSTVSVRVKKGVVPRIKSKFQGAVLICYNIGDSISNWQWYRGTTAISGATKQYYIPPNKDSYRVFVTDKDGCQNYSNSINTAETKSVSVYPNPAEDNFTIKFSSDFTGKTYITLYNATGLKVLEYQTEKHDEELEYVIPAGSLPDGLYSIKIVIDEEDVLYSRVMIIN